MSNPRVARALTENGYDLNDMQNSARALVAEVRGPQDPLERDKTLAQIDASKAQAQAARAQAGDQWAALPGGAGLYNKRSGVTRSAGIEQTSGPWKDPKQKADVEEGLRKEVTAAAKSYNTVRDAARSIEAIAKNADAAKTGALDMSLVFSFMKVLDPDSVVREAEYASAAKSAGLPDRIVGTIERVMSGKFLSPEQRAEFMGVAQTLATTRETSYREGLDRYRGISERLRVDPRNVLPEGYTPPAPPPGSTNVPSVTTTPQGGQQAPQQQGQGGPPPVRVQSAQDAMKLPPGTVFVTPDGRTKVRP